MVGQKKGGDHGNSAPAPRGRGGTGRNPWWHSNTRIAPRFGRLTLGVGLPSTRPHEAIQRHLVTSGYEVSRGAHPN
jgi:hypothetical protein